MLGKIPDEMLYEELPKMMDHGLSGMSFCHANTMLSRPVDGQIMQIALCEKCIILICHI